jgi:[ribosomal protein S5]-alanine N-acetyltransferase
MPVITHPPVVLRPFVDHDAGLVQAAASDPLITTVPGIGDPSAARACIARQHGRLASGEGYSFAGADAGTGRPAGPQ